MPYTNDITKGPLDLLASILSFTQGEYERGVQRLISGAGFSGFAYGRYFASEQIKKVFNVEVMWLWRGIVFIQFLQFFYGPANDSGSKYKSAVKDFQLAYRSLEAAVASESCWTGEAADAYNIQNDAQMARVSTPAGDGSSTLIKGMTELDADIAAILAKEVEEIKRSNQDLSWIRSVLVGLIPICSLLAKTQPHVSQAIQVAAVMSCVTAAEIIFSAMGLTAADNAEAIDALTAEYRRVGDDAATSLQALLGGTATATTAAADESTVPEFDQLNNEAATGAASSGPAASRPDEQPASLLASAACTGGGGIPADGSPQDQGTPMYTMPTGSQVMGRPSQASMQAAKVSQQATTRVSLVNVMLGTVEQDVDGAAAGVADAGCAPVRAEPGGAEQAQPVEK
jgi:hypothetical protein